MTNNTPTCLSVLLSFRIRIDTTRSISNLIISIKLSFDRDQRSKFSVKQINPALASKYEFASVTDMVDFIVIMTDIVSLHFIILYCLKYVCSDADDLRHTIDSEGTSRESNSISRQQSPRKREYNNNRKDGHKEYGKNKDNEGNGDGEEGGGRAGEGEDGEIGGGGGVGGETGGFYDSEDSFEGGSHLFSRTHGSDMLASSCRLHHLPFSIDYSPDRNGFNGCSRLQSDAYDHSNQGTRRNHEDIDGIKTGVKYEKEKETSGSDAEACEFIYQYSSYLDLDLMAVCCSLLEYPMALDAVLLAAGNDVQLDKVSTALGHQSFT